MVLGGAFFRPFGVFLAVSDENDVSLLMFSLTRVVGKHACHVFRAGVLSASCWLRKTLMTLLSLV